jgi:hypothetical protein
VSDLQPPQWYAETAEQTVALLEQIRSGPVPAPELGHGLFYRGQLHALIGESDAGKSLLMAAIATEIINAGRDVLWVDFEFQRRRNVQRMLEFGATDEALAKHLFRVNHPLGPPPSDAVEAFRGVELVVADACTGLLAASGLGSNSDVDVDQAYTAALRPFCEAGAAVVLIDHVTKDKESQGKYAVGSQRKRGAADVAWGFKVIQTFKRGHGGRAKLSVFRDRDSALQGMEFVLAADMTWRLVLAEQTIPDSFRPTALMEKVCRYVKAQGGRPVSRTTIEQDVAGKAVYLRKAIDALIGDGCIRAEAGPRNSVMCVWVRDFVATPSDPVPPRPDSVRDGVKRLRPPSRLLDRDGDGVTRP